MLSVNIPRGATLERIVVAPDGAIPQGAVWLDLLCPGPPESKLVEQALRLEVPTREEMQEIEPTSRLYAENGARYMTATLMCRSETDNPTTTAVTFILSDRRLITVRYDEPRPFTLVANKFARACPPALTGELVLMELLDAIVDRAADILERISAEVDRISQTIFTSKERSLDYRAIMTSIGRQGDLTSKARECLVSIGRLLLYLANEADTMRWAKDLRASLKGMQRDAQSLSDHATYLANKITFLLDAMVGVISIEQNNIIKIFSVAAVVFMPPTLIASLYGMNFKHMPELDWGFGYPMAIVLMIVAAIIPYVFFKMKRWL
jgi:magnesium transporter